MAHLNSTTNSYKGVEINIMAALAKTLGFQPQYYVVNGSGSSEWEQMLQENETYLETGLIGEVVSDQVNSKNFYYFFLLFFSLCFLYSPITVHASPLATCIYSRAICH